MASLNKVQIIGNLGRDPEIRYTSDNKPIANLNVATSEKWKNKTTGQQEEKTEWHRVVVFGGLAGVVQQHLKKGDTAYFEGKLQTRKWTDKDGAEKYTTEIVIDGFSGGMQMLGGGGGKPSGGGATKEDNQPPFDDDIPW